MLKLFSGNQMFSDDADDNDDDDVEAIYNHRHFAVL